MRSKPVKKYLAVFLCAGMLLNIFMSSAWCVVVFNCHEIGACLTKEFPNDHDLELIKIPVHSTSASSGFMKLNDHELMYNHKLYDVVRSVTDKNFTYYYCLNDSKEEKILERIGECVSSGLDFVNATEHGALLSLKLFSQENATAGLTEKNLPEACFVFNTEQKEFYSAICLEKVFSPPEIFVA